MNISPSFDEFVKLSQNYNLIPLYLEMPADLETPISLLYKVFDDETHIFLLESMEGPEKWARYSFIGFEPSIIFRAKGKKVYVEGEVKKEFSCEDPFLELKRLWEGFRVPENLPLPRFFSGLVGYVSYEMVSFFEKRVKRGEPVLGFHDLYFVLPRKLIVYDRLKHTYKLIALVSTEEGLLINIGSSDEGNAKAYEETPRLAARGDNERGARGDNLHLVVPSDSEASLASLGTASLITSIGTASHREPPRLAARGDKKCRLGATFPTVSSRGTQVPRDPIACARGDIGKRAWDDKEVEDREDRERSSLVDKERKDLEKLYSKARDELLALRERLRSAKVSPPRLQGVIKLTPEMERASFEKMVQRAKKYIEKGDIIQVVLSQRFYVEDEILKNPHLGLYLYRALRKINPSPYMFYLRFKDEVLIGSSPEILVRAEGKRVETRPIAGTRRRGPTEEEDLMLEEELKSDEKELAEHIMLVDLGRNDLGRVCEYGSVQVYDLMVVERYSHVMHLVSGVKGRLKDGEDMFSLFRACFPAGTVSGAPKVRAMEIITELEEKERGPYAGAVGYFGFNHTMDFCITIRTFFQKGGRLYLQAGAGIVADSNPKKEYEETINKAKALEKALELFSSGYFD
jgi:anthranilate/para-aminobenzoate synthase component I